MMQRLHDNLQFLKEKKQIVKIQFIQSAAVPIIKLVVDLQAIKEKQILKALAEAKREQEEKRRIDRLRNGDSSAHQEEEKEINLSHLGLENTAIDENMRYLKVDISIDESSEQFIKNESYSGV